MRYLLMLLPGLLLALQPATAEIYRWVDENGKVHFGDAPPRSGMVQRVEPRANSYRLVTPSPASPARETLARVPRVVMYSTRWCGYCKQARAYFNQNGIRFSEHDIERSSSARSAYDRLGGNGVPLILVGDQRMSGFSAERFSRLYGRQVSQSTSR
ncbi:MAG: glutaredoxin family protein [Sedimenticola sp.]|nr:glutaredoxin family protein [Sedimenticola sp.]